MEYDDVVAHKDMGGHEMMWEDIEWAESERESERESES